MFIITILCYWFGPFLHEISSISSDNKVQGNLVPIIIYKGEKMDYEVLPEIILYPPKFQAKLYKWNYVKLTVYTCYPYLKTLLATIKDLNDSNTLSTNAMRRKFIRQKEQELRQEFSARVRNMTLYEGKILLKLLYRSTQKTGYTLLKETRGRFMAGIYQGIANIFGGSLKYEYDPRNNPEDREIEKIYMEVEAAYGF